MLKDLPLQYFETVSGPLADIMEITNPGMGGRPQQVHQGIYITPLNWDHVIHQEIIEEWPDFKPIPHAEQPYLHCYGVCDHWSQVLAAGLQLLTDPRNFVILLHPVVKTEQPASGGWRWHKWGPYIGMYQKQVEAHEYIADTPDVEVVYCYHIYHIR